MLGDLNMPQWSPPRKAGGTGGLSFPLTFPDSLPQWSPPRKAGGTSTGFAANVDGWISRNGARPGRREEPSATVTVLQPPFYTPQWSPPRKAGGTRSPNVPPLTCPFERERER